jgi:trehalose 6-phosphate phosphatase
MTATEPTLRILEELGPATIGLFLDVDGTLLDIAPHPDAVRIAPGLLDDLVAAEQALGGALALVSGRPISELDRIFTPLRVPASGVHGAELRRHPGGPVASLAQGSLGDDAWGALNELLAEFPGSFAEHKRVSFAVHYPIPGTPVARLERSLRELMTRIAEPEQRLRLVAGKAVFEIQLPGFDKGQAIECFMTDPPFYNRRPVFIGDDEIDRAGFERALALGGFAFSVGFELPGLSGRFSGPDAVRNWLHEFSR